MKKKGWNQSCQATVTGIGKPAASSESLNTCRTYEYASADGITCLHLHMLTFRIANGRLHGKHTNLRASLASGK